MTTPVARRIKTSALTLPGIDLTGCKTDDAVFIVKKDCPMMVVAYNIDEEEYEVRMEHAGCATGEKAITDTDGEILMVNASNECVVLTAAGRYKFVAQANGATYTGVSFEVSPMTPAQVALMCDKGVAFRVD